MIKVRQLATDESVTEFVTIQKTIKMISTCQRSLYQYCFLIVSVIFLSGCSGLVSQKSGQHSISSSLSSFLNSGKELTSVTKSNQAQLTLPVRVGIAFLPSQHWRGRSLDESTKYQLLSKVKHSFDQYRFIENISIIPSTYLKRHGAQKGNGYDTLQQVARLYGVDVIALVSYDQLSRSQQNNASLLYWTIVGMYVIPGNENTIQTFVDTAIFDVRSRQLLMRAPGVSKLTKRSTAIGVDSVMNKKSTQGFELAFNDMIKNLDLELVRFKDKIKRGDSIKISNQKSYSAAGSMDSNLSLFLLFWFFLKLLLTASNLSKLK